MNKKPREFLAFDHEDEEQKVYFRRLRKKRPTKRLWMIVLMALALGYLFVVLRMRF